MAKHTIEELYQWQALPLNIKIRMTEERIREWVREYGIDGVYVSFSGGKDSTVLLHMAREMYPNIKAVFVDTGLEYPEIREFVKAFDNVDWLRPKMNFRQVIEKYGYPFISKEVSECVDGARRIDNENPSYQAIKMGNIPKEPARLKKLLGTLEHKEKGVLSGESSSMYDRSRYKFFLDAPFNISSMCCNVMKKQPVHKYGKETGRKPMTAQMASESKMRAQKWLQNGCNGFEMKSPISNPMAFWTEQDVLTYIDVYIQPYLEKLRYRTKYSHGSKRKKARKEWAKWNYSRTGMASVYGDIEVDFDAMGQVDGQMDMSDLSSEFGIFDTGRKLLRTTGCSRTGCMFCGYGAHCRDDDRFVRMKETHPKQYDYIMRPTEQGGLNYKEIIDWINEHGNLNIKY